MNRSPEYREAWPYIHAAMVASVSVQRQLDMLRHKVPEGHPDVLVAITAAESLQRQADDAVLTVFQRLQVAL